MPPADQYSLTNREKEVFDLIGQGLASRMIAAQLGIAYYTLRKHRLAILHKLCLTTSAQLAAAAVLVAESRIAFTNSFETLWYALSNRQRSVALHIVDGCSSKEIARLLNISPQTVGKHRCDIYRRLGVSSAAQLCRQASSLRTTLTEV